MQSAEVARNALINAGGRPRRGVNYRALPPEALEVAWPTVHCLHEEAYFREDLHRWEAFRQAQRVVRRDGDTLSRTQSLIDRYWRKRHLKETMRPVLNIDTRFQSRREEWKEFFFYQHQRLSCKEEEVKAAVRDAHKVPRGCENTTPESFQESHDDAVKGVAPFNVRSRWISSAKSDLKNWVLYLQWIEDELSKICLEEGEDSTRACTKFWSNDEEASRALDRITSVNMPPPKGSPSGRTASKVVAQEGSMVCRSTRAGHHRDRDHASRVNKTRNSRKDIRVLRRSLRVASKSHSL